METEELIATAAAYLVTMPVAAAPLVADRRGAADTPQDAIAMRADGLLALLQERGDYDGYFDPRFREAVSRERLRALFAQARGALGEPERIVSIVPIARWSAAILVGYVRGTATIRISVSPDPPHAVTGFYINAIAPAEDSFERLAGDLRALPGHAAFGAYVLGGGIARPVATFDADAPVPLGSAFKLWVLTEAQRQVAAGMRRWTDVLPLGPPSLGGTLADWPIGSPMTLQSLATLMISLSDNRATDTLMTVLGRARIDAAAAAAGGATPVPTTRELLAIKSDRALAAAWTHGDAAARRKLLASNAAAIADARLDADVFSGAPVAVRDVEWFASPSAIARTLDALRRAPGGTALAILAINPGTDPTTAARFSYLGFKGGSEPGVVTLTYLARTKTGTWYAVAGAWSRDDAEVSEAQFVGLMTRALTLLAAR